MLVTNTLINLRSCTRRHMGLEVQQPEQLGFPDIERYPRSLLGRLLYPLSAIHVRKR